MRLAVLGGEDQGGAVIALDHPGGTDADDAAMPALAVNDLAVGVAEVCRLGDFLVDFFDDALLALLAITVELIEFHRHLGSLGRITFREQAYDTVGDVHA